MYYMDQEMIKVAGSEEGDSRKIKKYVCVCVCVSCFSGGGDDGE